MRTGEVDEKTKEAGQEESSDESEDESESDDDSEFEESDELCLTPIHIAAGSGQWPCEETFSEKCEKLEPKDSFGDTPFFSLQKWACRNLSNNAGDNYRQKSGITPLHAAAAEGHSYVCEIILRHIKDKNPRDDSSWTPLHVAAFGGHLSVCLQGYYEVCPGQESKCQQRSDTSSLCCQVFPPSPLQIFSR